MHRRRITPEKYAVKLLTAGMVITIGIFSVALPIIVISPGLIQNEILILKVPDAISLSLVPGFGIILVLLVPLGRALGTAIIFSRSERTYSAAGFLVSGLLLSLIIYSLRIRSTGL